MKQTVLIIAFFSIALFSTSHSAYAQSREELAILIEAVIHELNPFSGME